MDMLKCEFTEPLLDEALDSVLKTWKVLIGA
jgi:hypothetical protein